MASDGRSGRWGKNPGAAMGFTTDAALIADLYEAGGGGGRLPSIIGVITVEGGNTSNGGNFMWRRRLFADTGGDIVDILLSRIQRWSTVVSHSESKILIRNSSSPICVLLKHSYILVYMCTNVCMCTRINLYLYIIYKPLHEAYLHLSTTVFRIPVLRHISSDNF